MASRNGRRYFSGNSFDDLPDDRLRRVCLLERLTRGNWCFGVRSAPLRQAAMDLADAGRVNIIADHHGVLCVTREVR